MPSMRLLATLAFALVVALSAAPVRGDGVTQDHLRFRLLLNDGHYVDGHDGVLTADRLTGIDRNGRPVAIDLADVHSLDVAAGNKAGSTALLGAGAGLASGLLAVVEVSTRPDMEVDESTVLPVIVAVTAVGALVGALIGTGMPRWERVPLQAPIGLSGDGTGPGCGLCLRF